MAGMAAKGPRSLSLSVDEKNEAIHKHAMRQGSMAGFVQERVVPGGLARHKATWDLPICSRGTGVSDWPAPETI